MQEYIGIFPSKFNYNKKLLLIGPITLNFCENKKIKKNRILDFFFSYHEEDVFVLSHNY
jgi:hypothetical protein